MRSLWKENKISENFHFPQHKSPDFNNTINLLITLPFRLWSWTSSIMITRELVRHAVSGPPAPRPAESECRVEQDPQIICMYMKAWETMAYYIMKRKMTKRNLWSCDPWNGQADFLLFVRHWLWLYIGITGGGFKLMPRPKAEPRPTASESLEWGLRSP